MARRDILLVCLFVAGLIGWRMWNHLPRPSQPAASIAPQSGPQPALAVEDVERRQSKTGSIEPEILRLTVLSGTLRLRFDQQELQASGLRFEAVGQEAVSPQASSESGGHSFRFPLEPEIEVDVVQRNGTWHLGSGHLSSLGGMLPVREGPRVAWGNLGVGVEPGGRLTVRSTLGDDRRQAAVFELGEPSVAVDTSRTSLRLNGMLVATGAGSEALGQPNLTGRAIGFIALEAEVSALSEAAPVGACDLAESPRSPLAGAIGPDVIVADLTAPKYYGNSGGIHAYAIGTHACNLGDERADWIANSNQHPVIVQNMYRLKDDRFEQIGMSWVKHGFYAVSWSLCGPCNDPTDGTQLGVGCSDPYSASLNGVQTNMSPRSTINAFTGAFDYPWSGWVSQPVQSVVERRLQVHAQDLDPALNSGAQYFVQGHYVMADDAAAGNAENNASYRPAQVLAAPMQQYLVNLTGQTQRGQPAIRAWADVDPAVAETEVRVPGEGLYILAGKATYLGDGTWRYSYALQNLNSDRSARSFSIPIPDYAQVLSPTFHGPDYHSGEPYDNADWSLDISSTEVSWSTAAFDTNANANALRFGIVFTFTMVCDGPPAATSASIGLFKPGSPDQLVASTIGPLTEFLDCNENTVEDRCDTHCEDAQCAPPCGTSLDCNDNRVPDECETDCNGNSVPDDCDLGTLTSLDCNANRVPDECDIDAGTSNDANTDGVPDECQSDCDGDGILDDVEISTGQAEDCNGNGVPDACEIIGNDCNGNLRLDECDVSEGTSEDCNGNGQPDECELDDNDCNANLVPDDCDTDCNGDAIPDDCQPFLDCNNNGQQDICDVALDVSEDCDLNWVPDECQSDCDEDGIPDACDVMPDTDGDGFWDCYDLCPGTPPGTCNCPAIVRCCYPGLGFCVNVSLDDCLDSGGVPDCVPKPCRDGCQIGDADSDGDLDLADAARFQRCYSGSPGWPGFSPPFAECARVFDSEVDGDVDLPDFALVEEYLTGP